MKINPEVVAQLQRKSIHPFGGTFADRSNQYLSGTDGSFTLIRTDDGFAFAGPGYQEKLSEEVAAEVVFAAQQIVALPFQRLSARQMENFLCANPAMKGQYYLFLATALGFSFTGMAEGKSSNQAIRRYHALQVKLALRQMKNQKSLAVLPSRQALADAIEFMPDLLNEFDEQIVQIRCNGGPLYTYHVQFKQDNASQDVLLFDCEAEDYAHAIEQARSSYPDAVLLHAFEPGRELVF